MQQVLAPRCTRPSHRTQVTYEDREGRRCLPLPYANWPRRTQTTPSLGEVITLRNPDGQRRTRLSYTWPWVTPS